MPRSSDVTAVLKGLDRVRKAGVQYTSAECDRLWRNSTIRVASTSVIDNVESKVTNVIVDRDSRNVKIDISLLIDKAASFARKTSTSVGSAPSIDVNVISSAVDKVVSLLRTSATTEHSSHHHHVDNEAYDKRPSAYDISDQELDNLEKYGVLHPESSSAPSPSSPPPPPQQLRKLSMAASSNQPIASSAIDEQPRQAEQALLKVEPVEVPAKIVPKPIKPLASKLAVYTLNENSQERKVPGTRVGRVFSFGSLAAGLGAGTIAEITRRGIYGKDNTKSSNPFLTEANIERIVDTLCRVRGAALKLGQMISIQDDSFISPQLKHIFDRVRHSADFMPNWQMKKVVNAELGPDWMSQIEVFDDKPFAAASIGEVHRAVMKDGRTVAMKIQYPGVAKSIESDINNLAGLMKIWKILPDGLYVDKTMEVARKELGYECNYIREAKAATLFRQCLADDPVFYVPEVVSSLSTRNVLTSELVSGLSLEQMTDMDQATRNYISENMLRLCLLELFDYHMMQTDPNWSNFLYDKDTRRISLLDFGATRTFSRRFTDNYIGVIMAAATGDRQQVLEKSRHLGFLSGYESKVMETAHVDAVMILGEPFASSKPFDFGARTTAKRVQDLIPIMLKHRLVPPPEESYSLHRKLSGAFLLATKLRGVVDLQKTFFDIYDDFEFGRKDDTNVLDD